MTTLRQMRKLKLPPKWSIIVISANFKEPSIKRNIIKNYKIAIIYKMLLIGKKCWTNKRIKNEITLEFANIIQHS
jgi:hypothetical protein